MLMYGLCNIKSKNGVVTEEDFKTVVRNKFRHNQILNVGKPQIHPQVTPFSQTTICQIFSATEIVPQKVASNKTPGKRKVDLTDVSTHAHSSLTNVCSFLNIPKNDPTGRRRLSPFLTLDDNQKPVPSEHMDILMRTQRILDLKIAAPFNTNEEEDDEQ
jgi:hypothetical protein